MVCNTAFCAYFGAWSSWGPCSASCGIGQATRFRYCHGGPVGTGLCVAQERNGVLNQDTIQCDMGDCCDWDWSGWTGCCKGGAQGNIRLRFRGGTCGMASEMIQKPCEFQDQSVAFPQCYPINNFMRGRDSAKMIA